MKFLKLLIISIAVIFVVTAIVALILWSLGSSIDLHYITLANLIVGAGICATGVMNFNRPGGHGDEKRDVIETLFVGFLVVLLTLSIEAALWLTA